MGRKLVMAVVGMVCCLLAASASRGIAADKAPAPEKLKVVILVGGHPFDQPTFDKFWGGYDRFLCETWKGSPYSIFDDVSKFRYDVIVMYNLSSGMTEVQKQNLLKLLDKGVGLVVWHHALANCQDWPEFEKIAGARFWLDAGERSGVKVPKSGVGFGKIKMHVAAPAHPITAGMADFEIEDETYNKQTFVPGVKILVTTEDPRSDKAIAWVHQYGKSRVFGYQSGHDARAWSHPSFKNLMAQGIRWAAGRLPDSKQ